MARQKGLSLKRGCREHCVTPVTNGCWGDKSVPAYRKAIITSAMEIFGQNNYFYVLTRLISNYISLSPRWHKKYFFGTRQCIFSTCVAGAWDYLKERGLEGDMPPLRLPLSSSACYACYRRKRGLSAKRGLGFPSVTVNILDQRTLAMNIVELKKNTIIIYNKQWQ